MNYVTLGMDTQTSYIGLAIVTSKERVPVWAGAFKLPGPDLRRDLGRQIRRAIRKAADEVEYVGGTVNAIGIERGVVHGTSQDVVFDLGGAYHLAYDAARLRFKDPVPRPFYLRPTQWSKDATGSGATKGIKERTSRWAYGYVREYGWSEVQINGLRTEHARDALGVAVSAATRLAAL